MKIPTPKFNVGDRVRIIGDRMENDFERIRKWRVEHGLKPDVEGNIGVVTISLTSKGASIRYELTVPPQDDEFYHDLLPYYRAKMKEEWLEKV